MRFFATTAPEIRGQPSLANRQANGQTRYSSGKNREKKPEFPDFPHEKSE